MKKNQKRQPAPAIIETPPTPVIPAKSQIVRRLIERCEKCDAINSFRQVDGMRDVGAFFQCHVHCSHCGYHAIIRREKPVIST